ncbi:tail fiber domain-containing protein [Altibacter sp. HG106]|uniref:tail fiber domain-containing protein n=1 Tax=Altibacter sp. HG106 TaxID=3023937 RepID=UPI00234FE7B9|nr:tail fiber domain-containing protein [Altibacter sp. HG106]MDC7994602.1 tail fiber domain-containing protein [Altibacter sp. HG106]
MNKHFFVLNFLLIIGVTASSQVGIGTTSPQATLDVESSSTTLPIINLTSSGGLQRLQLLDNGDIAVGNISPARLIDVSGQDNNAVAQIENTRSGTTADVLYLALGRTTPESSNKFLRFLANGAEIGSVSGNGSGSVLFNSVSDKRLKENITPIHGALSIVAKINPVSYNFKGVDKTQKEVGFLAQELYQHFPYVVKKGSDGPLAKEHLEDTVWAIDYGKLTPLLVRAIQEQQQELETKNEKISDLQERILTIEKALERTGISL